MVTKILINPKTKTAYGVEYENAGLFYQVKARKEVIISAGSINSAQLLMLSGIGPEAHLKNLSIPVLKDAPVGENLMDHTATAGIIFTIDKPYTYVLNLKALADYFDHYTGLVSTAGASEVILYSDFEHFKGTTERYQPEVELTFQGSSFAQFQGIAQAYGMPEKLIHEMYEKIRHSSAFMSLPMVLKPKSRGKILLRDANYLSEPLIYPNYYDDPYDLETAVKGIQLAVNISKEPALRAVGAQLYNVSLPACAHFEFASYDYFECYAKELTFTFYHSCGTCKMGSEEDESAVVDPRLRVKGFKGLRVVDSSVIPIIPRGHTNFPVMMIAEKTADLIKEDFLSI